MAEKYPQVEPILRTTAKITHDNTLSVGFREKPSKIRVPKKTETTEVTIKKIVALKTWIPKKQVKKPMAANIQTNSNWYCAMKAINSPKLYTAQPTIVTKEC